MKPDGGKQISLAGEDDMVDESQAVTVIGGGVSGLATAVELRSRGVRAVVLESSPQPGQSWLDRYDSPYARTQGISFVPCVALQVERSGAYWTTITSEGTFVSRHAGAEIATDLLRGRSGAR